MYPTSAAQPLLSRTISKYGHTAYPQIQGLEEPRSVMKDMTPEEVDRLEEWLDGATSAASIDFEIEEYAEVDVSCPVPRAKVEEIRANKRLKMRSGTSVDSCVLPDPDKSSDLGKLYDEYGAKTEVE
jgi:hypothetical protein